MTAPGKDNAPPAGETGRGAESSEAGNLRDHDSAGLFNEPACQCHINPSGCMVCRRWSKCIEGIEARRANSLRRQALGQRARAGG